MNPLLDFSGLPRFAEIRPEHVTPAVEQLLAENRALVARLLADPAEPTWDNFMQPLDDANERLSRAWGQVGHLNAVMNSPELREVYNANLPTVTQYYAELGQNVGLFNKVKAIRNSAGYAALSDARKLLMTLNPRQRDIVTSISLDGQSIAATAKRLEMSEVAVRVALHRALKALGAAWRRSVT